MLLIRTIHSFTLYHTFQKRNLGENPCYGAKWFAHSRDPLFYYKIGAKMSRKFKSHPSQKIITVNSLPKVLTVKSCIECSILNNKNLERNTLI